jgi:hypothetical protein
MGTALWTIVFCLAGLLLAYTTFLGIVGIACAFSGTRYELCSICHHHYFVPRNGVARHECPHGLENHVHQVAWSALHHMHVV